MSPAVPPVGFLAALGFASWPAERVVSELTALGYGHVEWTPAHLADLCGPALVLSAQHDLASDPTEGLRQTRAAIEAAHDAEIAIVNTLTGPNLWERQALRQWDEAAWSRALGTLEKACAHAEPLGVTVALEPCWGTLAADGAGARRALAAVPCAVTFDPSHFVVSGDDPLALVAEWRERIVHVHLKDAFGGPGEEGEDFIFCMLGEGKVPWPELVRALREGGYGGGWSVEFEAYRYYEQVLGGDPVAAARLGLEQAHALLAPPREAPS